MRAVVLSDSHGDLRSVLKIVEKHKDADVFIHLGDGRREIEALMERCTGKAFFAVKGNGDFSTSLPVYDTVSMGDKKIFLTHGHLYQVKATYLPVCLAARERKADVVLFGHTHTAYEGYDDGLYLLNPGSVRDGTYGILDVTTAGVVTNIVRCI